MKKLYYFFLLAISLIGTACEKNEPKKNVVVVNTTPCQQSTLRSSNLSVPVDVAFTNEGIQITYYDFEVICDFTTVNVTHTLVNGVLNITQQGTPNQANCICYTDVSYTIDGISQDEVNVIFINGIQVYCHNDNEEVEKYVNALKNNQYDDRGFPAFTYKHIDKLLEYRNEKDIITKYPRNPVSSFYREDCELGVYILWTIEYIRIKFVDNNLLIVGFPSMNPILRFREPNESVLIPYNSEAYQIASDAYYTWWTSNKDKTLIEIMEIDPLENTIYKWH